MAVSNIASKAAGRALVRQGHDPDCSYVLLVKAQQVDRFQDEEVLLRNACSICLSDNNIEADSITPLWKKFPSAWWVDLSHNNLLSLEGHYPRVVGSFNVSGNALKLSALSSLLHTHILRLHVSLSDDLNFSGYSTINAMMANVLPNVWVINDDFIASFDRREGSGVNNGPKPNEEVPKDIEVPSNNLGNRESKLIRAIQNCPPKGKYSDYFRLEILLEEYLQEACYFNCFAQQIDLQNNSSHRHIECMPFVDAYALLVLPHRLRLDLSVVLTASLMFPVPKQLLRDALLIIMAQYISMEDIEQLYHLPTFAKTALVCLLRRVSKKELQEWQTIQQYCPKPTRVMPLAQQKHAYTENAPSPLDYLDSGGFQFLRPIKEYLEQAIEVTVTDPRVLHSMVPFSELEIEIINKLPDVPTQSSAAVYFKEKAEEQSSGKANNASASYKEWIPFAARHTVLLLTKAPSCPPLTRPQQSKVKQELYFELLPILRAANMTMNDLDLGFVGPGKDGRVLTAKTTTLGPSVKPSAADYQPKAAGAKSGGSFGTDSIIMGAKALPFGTGLPRGAPGSMLSWKVQDVPRNYYKAWNSAESKKSGEANYTDDLESESPASQVFLTNSEAHKVSTSPSKVKSYSDFTISQYEFGAPAPLPLNHSFSANMTASKLILRTASGNETEIEYLMGTLRSPGKSHSHSTSHSDHLHREIGESGTYLSVSVSVPATNPASPDMSIYTNSSLNGGDIGMNLDGGQSRYSEVPSVASQAQSAAESEPFLMLIGEENAPEPTQTRQLRPFSQGTARQQPPSAHTMRPEHVSGALAKPILGFSADANWSNKFLLASPSAVAQANFTVGRTDPANAWNFIEYAPVLVHTPAARLAPETVKELVAATTRKPSQRTVASTNQGALSVQLEGQEVQEAEAGVPATQRMTMEDSLRDDALNPVEVELEEPPTVRTDDSSFNFYASPEAEGAVSSSGISETDSSDKMPRHYVPLPAHSRKPVADYRAERIEDPGLTLLKEMGTVRNIRFLKAQNDKVAALSKSSAKVPTRGNFEEDASLALSQSQGSFGIGDQQHSQWELDPADQQSPVKGSYYPSFNSAGTTQPQAQTQEDNVFLTGVRGDEGNEADEEEQGFQDAGDGYLNDEGELGIFEDTDETTSFPEQAVQYYNYETGADRATDLSAMSSRPLTPGGENFALPPRHYSETEVVFHADRKTSGLNEFGATRNTGRSIPIPEQLKIPPLRELLQSVSTLDIMKSKAKYPNIAVCSQSVEYGNQGINANVGTSWYPLMQKNVYRLSIDALNPDKLFVGAQVARKSKPAGRYKRAPGTLKPLRATSMGGMSSSLPAARMQALLHDAVLSERAGDTKDVVELAPDLSNSAYFKSLFKPLDRGKKLSKSASAPRPLPALPRKSTTSVVGPANSTAGGHFYEEFIPTNEDITTEFNFATLPTEDSVLDASLSVAISEVQPSITSSTGPLIQELKDTIHNMLSNTATPSGGSVHDCAPLTPPPPDHAPVANPPVRPEPPRSELRLAPRSASPVYMMDDETTAPSSPREAMKAMTVAGKKLLTSVPQISLEDDISSMATVDSAASLHSTQTFPRTVGKDIIKLYNDNIHKPNWDEFTDSSSMMGGGGGTPKPTITAARATGPAGAGKVRRTVAAALPAPSTSAGTSAPSTAGSIPGGASTGEVLRLAPTVVASTATLPRSTVIGSHPKVPTGRQPRHTIAGV